MVEAEGVEVAFYQVEGGKGSGVGEGRLEEEGVEFGGGVDVGAGDG